MAGTALRLGVLAFELVVGGSRVIEGRMTRPSNLELDGAVAHVAVTNRLGQSELPSVHVVVTPGALPRHATVAPALATSAVFVGRSVTPFATSLRVRAGERPRVVRDVGAIPTGRLVARRATPRAHLRGELIPVRVLVAIGARTRLDGERETGMRIAVASRTGNGTVSPFERKRRLSMGLHPKRGRLEPMRVVAARAVLASDRVPTGVGVLVTATALIVLDLAIALVARSFGIVTAVALGLHVLPDQRERRSIVSRTPDPVGESRPPNRAMTLLTVVPELGFVDVAVTRHAPAAARGSRGNSGIVTARARDPPVTAGEAETGMVRPDSIEIVPARLLVTALAVAPERSAVWIAVAVGAILKAQPAPLWRRIVALRTTDGRVLAAQGKARAVVIDLLHVDAIPSDRVVTARTVGPEPTRVRIFVAARALIGRT